MIGLFLVALAQNVPPAQTPAWTYKESADAKSGARSASASPGTRSVTLTLDNAKAEWDEWRLPGGGAYVADPPSVYAYASEFAPAKLIQVGLLDDAGAPISASFGGPGSDAMFRKVWARCGREYAVPPIERSR